MTPALGTLTLTQAFDVGSAAAPRPVGEGRAQLGRVAEEFEALFISELLGPMFSGLEGDGLFGAGSGETVYRSLMVQEYGKAIARSGGIGIAENVQREILKLQEVAQ